MAPDTVTLDLADTLHAALAPAGEDLLFGVRQVLTGKPAPRIRKT